MTVAGAEAPAPSECLKVSAEASSASQVLRSFPRAEADVGPSGRGPGEGLQAQVGWETQDRACDSTPHLSSIPEGERSRSILGSQMTDMPQGGSGIARTLELDTSRHPGHKTPPGCLPNLGPQLPSSQYSEGLASFYSQIKGQEAGACMGDSLGALGTRNTAKPHGE